MLSKRQLLVWALAIISATIVSAEQSCRASCINAANPNLNTGVGFQYYDSDCLDFSKSGLGCVGRTTGCRMCKVKGNTPDPQCPQCILDKYYGGQGGSNNPTSTTTITSPPTNNNNTPVNPPMTGAPPQGPTTSDGYTLVWSDEFNGNTLDTSKWQYEVNCDGGGNNELQCYTANAANVQVQNGMLAITAIPQNYNNRQYTSGRINTARSAAWKYGKFEMRVKLPNGPYLWPALWMMPRDSKYGSWAGSGEIDIIEARGQVPSKVEGTLHFGGGWPNNVYEGSGPRDFGVDLTADFHVYTLEWTPQQISWAVDGNVYFTKSLQQSFNRKIPNFYKANGQPFDQEFFFIINLAIGGGFFGGEANSLTTAQARNWKSPQLLVDYVRVYQRK